MNRLQPGSSGHVGVCFSNTRVRRMSRLEIIEQSALLSLDNEKVPGIDFEIQKHLHRELLIQSEPSFKNKFPGQGRCVVNQFLHHLIFIQHA
jgi:hypothetical protein